MDLIFTVVRWIIRDFLLRDGILKIFLTLRTFKAGSATSELRFVNEQPILRSPCSGSKMLRVLNQLTNLSRRDRFQGQPNLLDFDMFDAMIPSALKKLLNTQSNFQKIVSVEEQRAQNSVRFLRGRQIECMIYKYFRATGGYEAVQ